MDTANFRDFTKKRPPVYFILNGDERFNCYRAISPKKLQRAMNAFRGIQAETKDGIDEGNVVALLGRISNTMIFFLKPESYERFEKLVNPPDEDEVDGEDDSDEKLVDVEQLVDILTWLLGEVYSTRPTKPSSDSSTTSPSDGTGTSSTAGAQPKESIPSS